MQIPKIAPLPQSKPLFAGALRPDLEERARGYFIDPYWTKEKVKRELSLARANNVTDRDEISVLQRAVEMFEEKEKRRRERN